MKSLLILLSITTIAFSASYNFTSQGSLIFTPQPFPNTVNTTNLCYFVGDVQLSPQPNSVNITSFRLNGQFNSNATNCVLPQLTLITPISNSTTDLLNIMVNDTLNVYRLIPDVQVLNNTNFSANGTIYTYYGNSTSKAQPFSVSYYSSATRVITCAIAAFFALLF